MGNEKAVILAVILLFVIPLVYSAAGDSCTTEGAVATNLICFGGVWVTGTFGTIYEIVNGAVTYDVIYSSDSGWYACDSKGDGVVAGGPNLLAKYQIISVSRDSATHDFVCYTTAPVDTTYGNNIERIIECSGDLAAWNTQEKNKWRIGYFTSVGNSYYYCSANGRSGEIDTIPGPITLEQKKRTCQAAYNNSLKSNWTGTRCCGDQPIPEYYSDPSGSGGCWNNIFIPSGNRISDTNMVVNTNFDYSSSYGGVPFGWTRNSGIPNGGTSEVINGVYRLIVPQSAVGEYYGLKSNKILVRPNTVYNLSMGINVYSGIVGTFLGLHLYCHKSTGANNYVYDWMDNQNSGVFSQGSSYAVVSELFKTRSSTVDCQILPMFNSSAYGAVDFNQIKMYEDNPYVLNYNGAFYTCGKSSSDFQISGLLLNENYNKMCGYIIDTSKTPNKTYYCDGSKWVRANEGVDFHTSTLPPGVNLLKNPSFKKNEP